MNTATAARPAPPSPAPPPWYARPLGAVWVVAVLLLVLAAVSPPVRHQLSLSLSREDRPFVALSLAGGAPAQVCTPGSPVRFRVARHGRSDGRPVEYQVAVAARGRTAVPLVRRGAVAVPSGGTESVALALPPRSTRLARDVTVSVVGSRSQLLVHCPGAAR